jgi:hypothetical protein
MARRLLNGAAMLLYNGWRFLLDTVSEGVEVTVLGDAGWVCTVTGATGVQAMRSAIEAAEATRAALAIERPARARRAVD